MKSFFVEVESPFPFSLLPHVHVTQKGCLLILGKQEKGLGTNRFLMALFGTFSHWFQNLFSFSFFYSKLPSSLTRPFLIPGDSGLKGTLEITKTEPVMSHRQEITEPRLIGLAPFPLGHVGHVRWKLCIVIQGKNVLTDAFWKVNHDALL